jgi:hypothetical protein
MAGAGRGGGGAGGAGGTVGCRMRGDACSDSSQCCAPLICIGTCATGPSDRNIKRDLAPIDNQQILDDLARLPITTWSYKAEQPAARHIGPMAQDFKATFAVGSSDKAINQVDADGVAFAAIQALAERVKRLDEENALLRRQLAAIRADLAAQRAGRARTRVAPASRP